MPPSRSLHADSWPVAFSSPIHRLSHQLTKTPTHELTGWPARDFRTIHPYSHTMIPTKPTSPSHGAGANSSGTRPIGASFENATIRPAFSTPHRLSPTISPDATNVARRSARSGFAEASARFSYHLATSVPMITAN